MQLVPVLSVICTLLLCSLLPAQAQQKALVLVQDLGIASSHSKFLEHLSNEGYSLDVQAADSKSLRLRDWDTWLYDKLVIFGSSIADFGGAVDADSILEFVDDGRDVLIAIDSRASEELRGLISDFGVDVEPKGTAVVDHIQYVQSSDVVDHTVVGSKEFGAIEGLFGSKPPEGIVVYQGAALSISRESKQVLNALAGGDTTFAHVLGKAVRDHPNIAGSEIALVALVQARNNARLAIAGSIAMFSNRFWQGPVQQSLGSRYAEPANREFCTAITEWAFHERGVLRTSNLRHHRVGEADQPAAYRVSDQLEFSLVIEELVSGTWQPYQATDVQVEFVMLDPYVRTNLSPDANGTFSTVIHVPDVYGVFKFRVIYNRSGYSSIGLEEQIPVRPFRHNEYERFIVSAYPYYASVLSLMVAFVLLDVLYLYRK